MESKLKKQRKLKTILPMAVMKTNVPPNTEVNKHTPPEQSLLFKHRANQKGWFPGQVKRHTPMIPAFSISFKVMLEYAQEFVSK